MSDTTTKAAVRSDMLEVASRDVPLAISIAKTSDPALADFLSGKSLGQSKTVWVSVLTPLITWGVTRYGLGWDGATVGAVAVILTSVGTIIARCFTRAPITGVVMPAPVVSAAPPALVVVPVPAAPK